MLVGFIKHSKLYLFKIPLTMTSHSSVKVKSSYSAGYIIPYNRSL